MTGKTIGELVQADAALAFDYARCQARHQAVVDTYELVRKLVSPAE